MRLQQPITRGVFFGLVALLTVGSALAQPAALEPRSPLAKPDRVVQPPYEHRLVVKFSDQSRMRATPLGQVRSLANVDATVITMLQARFDLTFNQLIHLPDAAIAHLEGRAEARSGRAQPDLAGMMVVDGPHEHLEAAANALLALDEVEWIDFEQLTPPPPGGGCGDISPPTPLYHDLQTYHGHDPGINMTEAWTLGNMRGSGIKIADCEYGYVMGHEDLCNITMEQGQTIHPNVIANGWDEHGTAVFGEMISTSNAFGCHGLAYEAAGYFFTEWSVEEGFRRATCIANAIANMDAGDIVVLEMQTTGPGGGYGPAELNMSVWTLVRNATDADILVVAAAGNGDQDLDSAPYDEYRNRGDSGAIIVGAGTSNASHNKLSFSTYGQRVNVQGWGQNVFTLGYGSYAQHGGDKNQRYTAGFSGTSSATPIVAGACAALQSFAEANLGRRLSPSEMRDLLIRTGVPQGSGGHIGPLPDVYAAAIDLVAGQPAELTQMVASLGSIVSGTLDALRESDDVAVRTSSQFGFSASVPHIMELRIRAVAAVPVADTIDIAIESRMNTAGGSVQLQLRNWATDLFDALHTYPATQQYETELIVGIDAATYLRETDHRIRLAIRHSAVATFSASGFDSYFNLVQVTTNE